MERITFLWQLLSKFIHKDRPGFMERKMAANLEEAQRYIAKK